VRTPFPNNQIPTSLLNPVAQAIVNSPFYPQPLNGNLTNNQLNTVATHTNEDQGDARVDWAPSERITSSGATRRTSWTTPLATASWAHVQCPRWNEKAGVDGTR
jgi:hypothetical protein